MALTANTIPKYKSLGNGHPQLQNSSITDNGTTITLPHNTVITGTVSPSDNVVMTTATKGLVLKRGGNGRCGTFIATGATPVSVGNTSFQITDCVVFSLNAVGGTVGFTVVCTASDTSTYNYCLIANAA